MCAYAGESASASSGFVRTGRVHIFSARGKEKEAVNVKLILAHRIHWKPLADCKATDSNTLSDFTSKSSCSLEVARFKNWDEIKEKVKREDLNNSPGVTVHGKLHRRALLDAGKKVKVVLIANNSEERDEWMCELRFRISAAEVLYNCAKSIALAIPGSISYEEFSQKMNRLVAVNRQGVFPTVPTTSDAGASHSAKTIQKYEWLDKLAFQASLLTGSLSKGIGKVAEKVDGCDLVERTTNVVDIAKIFPGGASSIFQLVLMTFKIAVMIGESYRGRRELPFIFIEVEKLIDFLVDCITPILYPTTTLEASEELLERYPFKVLVKAVDLMGKIEDFLMKNKFGRFLNASEVEGFESELEQLELMVVTVVNTKKNVELNLRTSCTLRGSSTRPDHSQYFSGREEKMKELDSKLQEYSSAVITGFGGIGKTDLMSAFAARAENNGEESRNVFWIQTCETAADITESLAHLAGKLHSSRFPGQDRMDRNEVISFLHKGLAKYKPWLLCLDNLDNPVDYEIKSLLKEVMKLEGGWVIITSRSNRLKRWSSMKKEQRIMLSALEHDNALCVLWRVVNSITCTEKDDTQVNEEISQWMHENPDEFEALQEIVKLLSGLPLAIAQAGSYIGSSDDECKFSSYLKLYEKTAIVFGEDDADMAAVSSDQRSVLTTWNINVNVHRLPREAYHVYHIIAMLDDCTIPRRLVDAILENGLSCSGCEEENFKNFVLEPLIQMSSLLHKSGTGVNQTFEMHRVIRKITLTNLKNKSSPEEWTETCRYALLSVHSIANLALGKRKGSFIDSPEMFSNEYRLCVPHALCVAQRFVAYHNFPSTLATQVSAMYRFCGGAYLFLGLYSDAVRIFEQVIGLLRSHYGAEIKNEAIAFALRELGEAYVVGNELEKARKILEECLSMYELLLSEGKISPSLMRPAVANTLGNLGNMYMKLNKLDDAEEFYEKCLKMKRAIYPDKHDEIANILGNLSQLYLNQKNYATAMRLQKESLAMRRSLHNKSSNHPGMARSLSVLSKLFLEMKQFANAESQMLESLCLRRKLYGNNAHHIELSRTLLDLCRIYLAQTKLDEATNAVEEGIQNLHQLFENETVYTEMARALEYHGIIYFRQKNYEAAALSLEKSLSMYLDIQKEKNTSIQSTIPVRQWLVKIYLKRKMKDEAQAHINELNSS